MASDPHDPFHDLNEHAAVAAPIRAACADLHPSDALRAAVLLGLSARPPAPSPSRRWRLVVAASGLAAAAIVGFALRPPRAGDPPPTPKDATPARDGAADRAAELAQIAKERAADRAWFDAKWPALREEEKGKWVFVWSGGEGYGSSPDLEPLLTLMAGMSPQPKHRYAFRAGEEGDIETLASEWYAPRFAGSGFAKALGLSSVQGGDEIVLRKGDATVRAAAFSHLPLAIGVLGSKPTAAAGPSVPEFWLGSVGPTLMLTPEDDAALALSRWEVPGTETVMGVPCRRVLVEASIPGIPGSASVVAAVPDVPYARLVALSRARNRFWEWPDPRRSMLDLPGEGDARGQWVVFGNDRVLGRGPTAETALADADAHNKDVVYQRFVRRWPEAESPPVGRDSFAEPCALAIGGTSWKDATVLSAHGCATPEAYAIAPLDDESWVALGLHRAEGFGSLIVDQELNRTEQPAPAPMKLGRQAFVRARVGVTRNGRLEQPAESRLVLVVEDPEMAAAQLPR